MRAALGTSSQQRDAVLVLRYRDGDLSAFAELYETHHPRLLRCVRRQVRHGHIAEDLAHDAFAAALAGIADLRDPARFYPWLVGIARVLVVRHYRAAGRASGLADTVPVESEAPEHALLRRVDHDNVKLAMGRLRERYREVLRLHEHEELSYSDIAERLNLSPSIVKLLMHRARRALRREYLAVTEPERTAAVVPLLYGGVAALRRLRDRALQIVAHVPDGGAVTASMAAAAIGMAGFLSPVPHESQPEAADLAPPEVGQAAGGQGVHAEGQIPRADAHARPSRTVGAPGRPGDVTVVMRYQPDVAVDEDEMRRRRANSRHMPYSTEVGPTWVGIDPDQMRRDIESSLQGDFGWMEGS
jgi:RNA polymerase sigma factor (sigma-70 family)